ncbi:hypothetical protein [Microbacterium sp. AG238]|uniref:hypothetical protein n=1 Tax=Microbacterium sp. AG238 TaxID=2183994 RepID=UPI001C7DBB68|nr:hypothetical protein [Microbacterium sp. AG238]
MRAVLGRDYRIDMTELVGRITDGYVTSEIAGVVVQRLRGLADQIDSEVASRRDLRDGPTQLKDSEAERFECAVTIPSTRGLVHRTGGVIGVAHRVLRVLLRGCREIVARGHGAPSVDSSIVGGIR